MPQRDLFREVAELRERGAPAALATVIATRGSTPGREAMKMLVLSDGTTRGTVGGGVLEEEIRKLGLEAIATESCRRTELTISDEAAADSEMICGGAVEVFVEPITVPTCHVLGAGHLGAAVARVAQVAGFRVAVADDRPTHASPERFPEADELTARPFPELLADLAPRLGPASYCVIVTRAHRLDEECAAVCLASPARYVGMIGSAKKVGHCLDALRARGLPEEVLARLRAPVGLDLGARTHGEIAVAIVGEMVAVRRGAGGERRPGTKRERRLTGGRPG